MLHLNQKLRCQFRFTNHWVAYKLKRCIPRTRNSWCTHLWVTKVIRRHR